MAIDPFFGSVLSAATGLIGGGLNALSSDVARGRAQDQINNQIALQREFATTGVTWKARDVMRAYEESGIHPLALLGVQGPTYTPVTSTIPADGMGDSIARAGQDISRGIQASSDRELRETALKLQEVALANAAERGGLENELLRMRIASEQARMFQSSTPGVPSGINHPGVERKIIDDVSVARTPRGGYVVLPGREAQERMEEIFGLGPEWFARNRAWLVTPQAREWVKRFLPAAPPNMEWRYNAPTGEWLPEYMDYPDRHLPNTVQARGVQRYIGIEAPNYLTR